MHGDMSVRAVEYHRYQKRLWLYVITEAKGSELKTDSYTEVLYSTQNNRKTIYGARELSANSPPNEGFISLLHGILIMHKEFKRQESDYKTNNCS